MQGAAKRARVVADDKCMDDDDPFLDDDSESDVDEGVTFDAKKPDPRGGCHDEWRAVAMKLMITTLMSHVPEVSKRNFFGMLAKQFTEQHPDHNIKAPQQWFSNLFKTVSETGSTSKRPRSGRPSKLSVEQVRRCNIYFKRGVGSWGEPSWYGYTSIEHAARVNRHIKKVLLDSGVSIKTLWNRMQQRQIIDHGKPFKKISILIKPELTNYQKATRLRKAREWMKFTPEKMMSFIWLDEKQEYITTMTYRCYADDNAHSISVPCHKRLGARGKKVKYISGVSAIFGPAFFELISGTSDYDSGFKVRT